MWEEYPQANNTEMHDGKSEKWWSVVSSDSHLNIQDVTEREAR